MPDLRQDPHGVIVTRADVANKLTAERYTPHVPDYLIDDPVRCAERLLVLAEAIAEVLPGGCGTTAGYEHHRREGEKPCAPCRDARRLYDRSRYAARRKALLENATDEEVA